MSDIVIHRDPKLTKAADAFVESMASKTDGKFGQTPLWCEWALRHAFEQGVAWAITPITPEERRLMSAKEQQLRDAIGDAIGLFSKQYDDEEFTDLFASELLPKLEAALAT